MIRVAVPVDPSAPPLEQYRYGSEWSEIIQYLTILYAFSKTDFYKAAGGGARFQSLLSPFRNIENYSYEWQKFLEEILDANEYAKAQAELERIQKPIEAKMYKPLPVRQLFTSLRDDIPHVHSPRIKAVLMPLMQYFRNGSEPMVDVERQALEAMKVVRNPRIRRIIIQIEGDLDLMATGGKKTTATKDEIALMSRGERLTIIKDTDDESTLDNFWAYVEQYGDRSVAAALFHKGYVRGNAPRYYRDNRLITPGNFKKLSDEVLKKYLKDPPYQFRDKWRAESDWKILYSTVLPGRPELCKQLVRDPGVLRFTGTMYAVAGEVVPPTEWNADDAARIWRYVGSEAREKIVKVIPLAERLAKYAKDPHSFSENVWLADATKDDVVELFRQGKLDNGSFISHIFGPTWGSVWNASDSRWDFPNRAVEIQQFLAGLDTEDVKILVGSALERNLRSTISRTQAMNGGVPIVDFCVTAYGHASDAGKKWWITLLPALAIERIAAVSDKTDEEVDDHISAAFERNQAANMQEAENILRRANVTDPEDLPQRYWKDYIAVTPDKELWGIYLAWRKKDPHFVDWEEVEQYLASHLSRGHILEAVQMGLKCRYAQEDTYRAFLSGLKGADAVTLRSTDNEYVRDWVASNYPRDQVSSLLSEKGSHGWVPYLEKLCTDLTQDQVSAMIAWVETNPQQLGGYSTKALTILLKQYEGNTDRFMNSPESSIIGAAASKCSASVLRVQIADSNDPKLVTAMLRDDFGVQAEAYLDAFFGNDQITDEWGSTSIGKKLDRFDMYAYKISSDDTFFRVVDKIKTACEKHRTLRGRKPFSFYTFYRLWKMGQLNFWGDLEGGGWTTLKWIAWDQNFYSTAEKALSTDQLKDLIQNAPFKEVRNALAVQVWADSKLREDNDLRMAFSDKTLEDMYEDRSLDWSARHYVYEEMQRRKSASRDEVKLDLAGQIKAAKDRGDFKTISAKLEEAVERANKSTANKLFDELLQQYGADSDVIQRTLRGCTQDVLVALFDEQSVAGEAIVVRHAPASFVTERVDRLIIQWQAEVEGREEDNELRNQLATRNTLVKSTLIERSTPEDALRLFKYFFQTERQFGPKVRDAFLRKIDSSDEFVKLLKKFLLSKEFNLRAKKFTEQMVPVVLKLDDAAINARFNASSRFRSKQLGGIKDYWKKLKSRKEKEEFLKDLNDRASMEKLLRGLCEEVISLRSPLNEEFEIGTNNAVKVGPFLERFQKSTKTITHSELFSISLAHTSDAELKEWLLTNPLRVFDYNKPITSDPSRRTIRIDEPAPGVGKRVADQFLHSWDHGAHGGFSGKVNHTYAISTDRVPKRTSRNIKILYHGTDYFACGCIIQGGFKVMSTAKTGRMLGNGIYFSDVANKVAQYVTGGWSRGKGAGIVLVCEVDLGNMLVLDSSNSHLQRTWMNNGYDSVYWPKRSSATGGYGGANSEYCVSDVKRIKLLYVLDMERVY